MKHNIGKAKTLPKAHLCHSLSYTNDLSNITQDASNKNTMGTQVSQAPIQKPSPKFHYQSSFSAPITVRKYKACYLLPHCPHIHHNIATSYQEKSGMQSCDQSTLSDSNGAKITSELTNKPWSSQKSNVFAVLSLGSFSTLFRWNTYFPLQSLPFCMQVPSQDTKANVCAGRPSQQLQSQRSARVGCSSGLGSAGWEVLMLTQRTLRKGQSHL